MFGCLFILIGLLCSCQSSGNFGVFGDAVSTADPLAFAKELGVTVTRAIAPWYLYEPQKGIFIWTLSDNYINKNYEAGIDLIITISARSLWGTAHPSETSSSLPKNLTYYGESITKFVDRYRGKVKYYQIENEVAPGYSNIFWKGTKEEFKKLSNYIYSTIKSVDPSIQVVEQGFSNLMFLLLDDIPGLKDLFKYLMTEIESDLLDFHQYYLPKMSLQEIDEIQNLNKNKRGIITTESGDFDTRLILKYYNEPKQYGNIWVCQELFKIHEFVSKFKELNKGILHLWNDKKLTEMSVFLLENNSTRELIYEWQAISLVQRILFAFSKNVQIFCGEIIADFVPDKTPDFFHTLMGLVTKEPDYIKKPAFYTYQMAIQKMKNFGEVRSLSSSLKNVSLYEISIGSDKIWVVWNEEDYSTKAVEMGKITEFSTCQKFNVSQTIVKLDPENKPIYNNYQLDETSFLNITRVPLFVNCVK